MPSWINLLVGRTDVIDETSFLQLGQQKSFSFFDFELNKVVPSFWNKFPSEKEPENRYKFVSINVNQDKDLKTVYRTTYSLLDWMGDIGGLYDALVVIGSILVKPFASIAVKGKLLSRLVTDPVRR